MFAQHKATFGSLCPKIRRIFEFLFFSSWVLDTINKKIKQIVNSDHDTINHYKNLKYDLKEFKRVHIDRHFVLTFKVSIKDNFILFADFDHHDNVYNGK